MDTTRGYLDLEEKHNLFLEMEIFMQIAQDSNKIEQKLSYFLKYFLQLSQKSQGSDRNEQIILLSFN